jgi:membrane-associated phospholipid phosphatase
MSSPPERVSGSRYRLVDLLSIAYMGVVGIAVVAERDRIDGWQLPAVIHLGFVALAFALIYGAPRRPDNRVLAIARIFYPGAAFLLGYGELDRLHALIFPNDWATSFLMRADLAVFGTHPTVWVQQWYGSWADEILSLCYLSYYVLGLSVCVPWIIRGHKDQVLAAGAIAALTYYLNYTLFYVMPAQGPRFVPELAGAHTAQFHGPVFASLCRTLMGDAGAVKGGCFPSSHVSGAVAWSLACLRYGWPSQTRIIAGLSIGLTFGTVYLGYHYGVDPLGGLVMGLIGYFGGVWWLRLRGEDPPPCDPWQRPRTSPAPALADQPDGATA